MQVVFIILQIMKVLNLSIVWMFSPALAGSFFGTIYVVGYVLWADKHEKL